MKIVDAQLGQVVEIGKEVKSPYCAPYTILAVERGNLLTRCVALVQSDKGIYKVDMAIIYFPRRFYGKDFPVGGFRVAIFPS